MNALTTIEAAPTAGPHGEGHTIFSHRRQADFLSHLATFGNVRLACRAARVSAQTAYRARRGSAAFARAWDASLLAARDHAEQVLADRAVNGWEEAVFYHGEEVARRRRYSDRLLLAHLARLDRLAERDDLAEALPHLDAAIEALRDGDESLVEALGQAARDGDCKPPQNLSRDRVPCVPSCRNHPPSSSNAVGRTGTPSSSNAVGRTGTPSSSNAAGQAGTPSSGEAAGQANTPSCCGKDETAWQCDDCPLMPELERRLRAMEAARPDDAPPYAQLGPYGAVEARQLAAFEAGREEWWLLGVGPHEM